MEAIKNHCFRSILSMSSIGNDKILEFSFRNVLIWQHLKIDEKFDSFYIKSSMNRSCQKEQFYKFFSPQDILPNDCTPPPADSHRESRQTFPGDTDLVSQRLPSVLINFSPELCRAI